MNALNKVYNFAF